MAEIKRENGNGKKLVENMNASSLKRGTYRRHSTKAHAQKTALPHLRPHYVNGQVYYYYCRGTDPEIYLGSADTILRKCKGVENVG